MMYTGLFTTFLVAALAALSEYQPKIGRDRKPVGEPIPNYYVPIISEDTYYKAQQALDSRKRHRGPTSKFVNILGGLCKDLLTQSTMYPPRRRAISVFVIYRPIRPRWLRKFI